MERRQQLHAALVGAFSPAEMERLLRQKMDLEMDSIALGSGLSKEDLFFEIVEALWRSGRLLELAKAAYQERSANEKVRAFYETHIRTVFAEEQPDRLERPAITRMYMGQFEPTSEGASTTDRERIRMLEIRLRGIDNDNGVEGKLRHLENEVEAMQATLGKLMGLVQGMQGAPRQQEQGSWLVVLFWVVAALVLIPLVLDFVRSISAALGG